MGGGGRIEGEVGEEFAAARIPGGEIGELVKVAKADFDVVVAAFDERGPELAELMDLHGELGGVGAGKEVEGLDELVPELTVANGRFEVEPGGELAAALGAGLDELARSLGADAGDEEEDAGGGDAVARVFTQAQKRDEVFDVGGFEELEAAVFVKGDVSSSELELEGEAVMGGSEKDGLTPEQDAFFAVG